MRTVTVTQVLKPWSNFDMIRPEVLAAAAERGTLVHDICAKIALGEWVPFVPEECRGYVESFRTWFEGIGPEAVLAVEFELYDQGLELKGHPDLLIMAGEYYHLIDLKTPTTEAKTWGPQLAAYGYMLGKIDDYPSPDRAYPLMLRKEGSPPKAGRDATANDLAAFHCALGAYRYFDSSEEG